MTNALKHVLCIDDERDILEVAKMSLETVAELDVTCLNSGAEAIAKTESINPDFILLDVMMPQIDRPATLKKLHENPVIKQIPIAFMTARVQQSEINEYLQMGASGVIPKPFDPMTLASQITTIWEKFHSK